MAFGKKNKSNWDRIRNRKSSETTKYRDVYEDQQLERGDLAKVETMTTRNILNICVTAVVFILVWLFVSMVQMLFSGDPEREYNPHPQNLWVHVQAHYENVNDTKDKLTVAEFEELQAIYDPNIPEVYEPVKPSEPVDPATVYKALEGGGYVDKNNTYIATEKYVELVNEYKEYSAIYETLVAEYEVQLKAYNEYKIAIIPPKDRYRYIKEHYKNRRNFDEFVLVEDYNNLVKEYELDVTGGKIDKDLLDIPFMPFNPAGLYAVSATGSIPVYDETGRPVRDEATGEYVMNPDQPIEYRHVFDGSKISYLDYNNMMRTYESESAKYLEAYQAHRVKFHPDNIDGTAKVLDLGPNLVKVGISGGLAAIVFGVLYMILSKNLKAQNLMSDTSDINQYKGDQHIALPEEIQRNYDWFPDVGAHSAVQVSSMISHMALTNKGLKTVKLAKRADKDIVDESGDIVSFKGEILEDQNGNPLTNTVPMIDEEFMEALFDASGAPKDKNVRRRYDATKIQYNPDGSNRDKLGKYDTVADLINDDWEFPIYEPQRPGGAYIVDTAPVNTMVLAITRAGKGQTVIEPTLDMWMREKRPNNMVINDPKGELLVKNYVRATVRGLQVVQFNLINAMKTDIYNPLAMAAEAAREGDNTKCAMYIENIAEVFFPLDGGEDPLWPNAANNAFKRAAYGLLDYYLEEEKAMRRLGERTGVDEKILEQRIDEMWGKVTLYNCYQLFVQLSSKKMKNPAADFSAKAKNGDFNDLPESEYKALVEKVKNKSKLWEDKPEVDLLTLFFSATDMLPRNSMRTLVGNANNALKAIGGADKMISSVYGIAITAMSFFTDPTISTLTSGTLNQNVDLGGLSFPRRMGVRFNSDYVQKYHFVGLQAVWNAYEDKNFEKCLGKEFYHEDMVTREGWARYYFDGKFKNEIAYIKLEIKNPSSGSLVRTFYFEFRKNYQTSLDGRVYMKDPVLEEKIVKNGILTELRKFKKKDDTIVFRKAKTTFKQEKILDFKTAERTEVNVNAIISTMCKYSEKPKMIFLVTPPHLMKYAKLILILIKQLVDLNFDKSYMTKSNQKPLYKTRFMLDELGNLQSEGHGISGFETMLSIGLGQEQQFTLILQTLQQLRDVYGDSVDKIVQGNTSNIVFLKSTDDSMLETLSKMSGTRHVTYTDSKTITRDMQAMLKMTQNEGKASYNMTTKEEPVISYNDMAFISERNSIVFRAGDSPIWNRNETILPMSWRLFKNTIIQPGKEYSLQTIPTLSTAMDFDVRKNQPNFQKMLEKRMNQAYVAEEAMNTYKEAYGYTDYDVEQLDPDTYSDEIMDLINSTLNPEEVKAVVRNGVEGNKDTDDDEYEEIFDHIFGNQDTKKNSKFTVEKDVYNEFDSIEDNNEQKNATAQLMAQQQEASIKRYAGKMISRDMLISPTGVNHGLDAAIVRVYKELREKMEKDTAYFSSANGHLYGLDGKLYIRNATSADRIKDINAAIYDENSNVYSEEEISVADAKVIGSYEVTDDFLRYLVSFPKAWPFADGEFELKMKAEMTGENS